MARFVLLLLFTMTSLQGMGASFKPSLLKYNPSIGTKLSPRFLEEPKESIWKRVSFGGNIGLQFGTTTSIILSPAIGYTPKVKFFQDRVMFGLGLTYMYFRSNYYGEIYESNIWGGRVFTRVLITKGFFTYFEYELLNSPPYQASYYDIEPNRVWVSSVLVGGGYLMRFSSNGGIMITVLYNLAWTPVNPVYSSPWNFRVGFMI